MSIKKWTAVLCQGTLVMNHLTEYQKWRHELAINYIQGNSGTFVDIHVCIYKLFEKIGKMHNYVNLIPINLNEAKQILVNCEKQNWSDNLLDYPKLRFYRNFKYCKETEAFVYCVHNRSQRSILAQLRCGILPLKVETGRFNQIPLEFRLCTLCDQNSVEDECHFLFDCTLYDEIRTKYFRYILQLHPYYFEMSKEQKLNLLMSKELVKYTAEFVYNCYIKRRSIIYSS
jgi:hypothetical protein